MAAFVNVVGGRIIAKAMVPARGDQIPWLRAVVRRAVRHRAECETIILLADELATNALLHSGTECIGLVIAETPSGLRLAVADQHRTHAFPHLRAPEPVSGPAHADPGTTPGVCDTVPSGGPDGRLETGPDAALSEHGRGLCLIETLATGWGVACTPGLLLVWFDISATSA